MPLAQEIHHNPRKRETAICHQNPLNRKTLLQNLAAQEPKPQFPWLRLKNQVNLLLGNQTTASLPLGNLLKDLQILLVDKTTRTRPEIKITRILQADLIISLIITILGLLLHLIIRAVLLGLSLGQ